MNLTTRERSVAAEIARKTGNGPNGNGQAARKYFESLEYVLKHILQTQNAEQAELFIENLEARDEDVVGDVGQGFKCLLDGLNPERIAVAFAQIGTGRAALRKAVQYAKERVVFDRPIGKNQAIAHPLADSYMRLSAAEMVAMKAAQLFDARQPCGPEANTAKYLATEAAFEAADRAMQTLGGYSYAKEYHVERYWRETRLLKIAPISQEMVLNYISQKVLDLPKSY